MRCGGDGQGSRGLRVASEAGERERPRADERGVDGGPLGAQRGDRVVAVGALVGGAFPEVEPGLGGGQRTRVIARPGPVRARGGVQQQGGAVDLVSGEVEPVSGRRADDEVGAELRPRPRHEDLQRLPRPLRQLVRPQPFHQPLGAAPGPQVPREQREQPAQPGRGDLLSSAGDTREQGEVNGHPCRLTKVPPLLPYSVPARPWSSLPCRASGDSAITVGDSSMPTAGEIDRRGHTPLHTLGSYGLPDRHDRDVHQLPADPEHEGGREKYRDRRRGRPGISGIQRLGVQG